MADDIKKINDEINKLRAQLDKEPLQVFSEKDLKVAKALLSGLHAEIREMSSDLDYVAKSFKDSVNELSNQKLYLSDARKSLLGISEVSRKIVEYRKGESSLNEKQLKDLQKLAKIKFDSLRNDLKSGTLNKANTKELKEALKQEDLFNDSVEKTIKYQKEVNRQIGLLGTGLGGASKLLSKMGFGDLSRPLNEAVEKAKSARLQIKLNNDISLEAAKKLQKSEIEFQNLKGKGYKNLKGDDRERYKELNKERKIQQLIVDDINSQNKELSTQTNRYKNIGIALKEQITYTNLLDFVLLQIVKSIIAVDKQTGDLAKGFNITYNEANDLRDQLYLMAQDSGKLTSNTRAYQETILAIGKSLGSNAMLNEKDVETFTLLRDAAGFTNDELIKMQKLTFVSGGHLEDNYVNLVQSAKAVGLNNKVLLNEKDIMRDVANTSDAIKLSLGGSSKELGAAAAQVKVLGMNMKQVEDIAGSLLDFESSIKAELEAELLTGKDLNLERARLYAINNDMAGVAREIRKNYGSIEEFGRLNRIQQEAAAKAVGMSREELAKTLTDEKALNKLSGDDLRLGQAALDFARSRGMSEEQIRKKTIKDLENQMTVQEKLNASIDKFKEAFVGISQTILPIVSGFAKLVGFIASSLPGLRIMQALMVGILARSVATAVANIFGAGARTGNILTGIIAAGIGTAALFGAMDAGKEKAESASRTGNDVLSPPPGYGKRTLFGPEGKIHFNDKDTIVAGTDLKPNKIQKPSSIPPPIDYNKMAVAFAKEGNNRPIYVQTSLQVEGKEFAKIVGNESTTLFTNINKTVRQTS